MSLDTSAYQGKTWATRQRPWVDRLASAWLIGRFIDSNPRFLWLSSPEDCPSDAIGYDFDGATFTHATNRVTFETLVESFGLRQPALLRLGTLVHYLDVGGEQPSDAPGIESVLMGLREIHLVDDALLDATNQVFDSLYQTYAKES
ncbi:chromate resistance protein ChrB domain-containing protein [Orrella marina]|uniref:chromate resistance protein ChrB domain-containing protein n=1 Tax=Orrella marina TaxID=2163011 RepID=UPI001D130FDF|nr:chromate resistance protein ChrB domain-containing protein [Orrella marina]